MPRFRSYLLVRNLLVHDQRRSSVICLIPEVMIHCATIRLPKGLMLPCFSAIERHLVLVSTFVRRVVGSWRIFPMVAACSVLNEGVRTLLDNLRLVDVFGDDKICVENYLRVLAGFSWKCHLFCQFLVVLAIPLRLWFACISWLFLFTFTGLTSYYCSWCLGAISRN